MSAYKKLLVAGAGAALLAGVSAVSVSAAPLATSASSLKTAAPAAQIEVQQRGWNRNRGGRRAAIAAGAFGVGVIAGATIANSNRGYYGYGDPYGYEGPVGYYDDSGYYDAPGYYGNQAGGGPNNAYGCTNYGDPNVNTSQPC